MRNTAAVDKNEVFGVVVLMRNLCAVVMLTKHTRKNKNENKFNNKNERTKRVIETRPSQIQKYI